MSVLTSMLARDGVIPIRAIEEALLRQVVSGGDVETVLLEMDVLPENVLNAYVGALYGLLPATRQEVMEVPRRMLQKIPKEAAIAHRMVPIGLDGRLMMVARTEPMGLELLRSLAPLGFRFEVRIVTAARMGAALFHHYEQPLPPRIGRLVRKLRERDPGPVPYVTPPEGEGLLGGDQVSRGEFDSSWLEGALSKPPPPLAGEASTGDAELGEERPARTSLPPVLEALGWSLPQPGEEEGNGETEEPGTLRGLQPVPMPDSLRDLTWSQAPVRGDDELMESGEFEWAEDEAGEAGTLEPARESDLSEVEEQLSQQVDWGQRLRDTLAALSDEQERDALLRICFSYLSDQSHCAVLFLMHKGKAHAHLAEGLGEGVQVEDVVFPLDRLGSFALARRTGEPYVGKLNQTHADRQIMKALGADPEHHALIYPVSVGGRVVLMIYMDRKGTRFDLHDLHGFPALVPPLSRAFEALIYRRKSRVSEGGHD